MSQSSFRDEQRRFRDFVARLFREQSPVTRARDARELMSSEAGYDPDPWRRLGGELGLTGVHVPEAYGGQGFGAVQASARRASGRWRLQGTKSYVLDGRIADLFIVFIVAARERGSAGSDGVSLFVVQPGAAGLVVEPLQTVDATRPLSRLLLSGPAISIAAGGTDAIQRNIIAERVLGLPKEARDDIDVPFRDLRRNPSSVSR